MKTIANTLKNKITAISITVTTVVTAALFALSGPVPVGAVDTNTYDCGTYGGGNYDQSDCTDPTTTTTTGGSSSSSSSSSTKSTSGSSSSSSTSSTTVSLDDSSTYATSAGTTATVKKGDVITFHVNGVEYTLTVTALDSSNLTGTVTPSSTTLVLPLDQSVKYDADKDGTPDVGITYNQLSSDGTSASVTFVQLASATTNNGGSTNGSSNGSSAGGSTTETTTQKAVNLWWLWIIPIIFGIGLVIFAVLARRRRKAAEATGSFGGSNYPQF